MFKRLHPRTVPIVFVIVRIARALLDISVRQTCRVRVVIPLFFRRQSGESWLIRGLNTCAACDLDQRVLFAGMLTAAKRRLPIHWLTKKMNFVGLICTSFDHANLAALGPVLCRVGTENATGEGPELRNSGVFTLVRRSILRAPGARFRRGATGAPFFTTGWQPVCAPHVLTLAERNTARGA